MRTLITGASGFAGGYLARACSDAGEEVIGVSGSGTVPVGTGAGVALDLRDGDGLRRLMREFRPDVTYHLAAFSSVGQSWEDPARAVNENMATAASVLEAVRLEGFDSRVVWVSSCEVYGNAEGMPIDERAPLKPANPYAVSKTAGELLASVYADAHGLDIIRVRPFNHAGPGQRPTFIVSSLARQAAEAKLARRETIEIVTGNPDTRRDFTDVRDVVAAYRLLAAHRSMDAIYNISSGRSVSAADQVRVLGAILAPVRVRHVVDPSLVRGHEVTDLRGENRLIREATGWEPRIPLHQTLLDTVEWWERELAGAGEGAGGGG